MRVRFVDGREYRVWFKHYQFTHKPWCDLFKGRTECYVQGAIGIAGFPLLSAVGKAWCSSSDTFDKAKGRKLALTRALERFPKADRKVFWEAYLSRAAQPLDTQNTHAVSCS